MVKTPGVVRIAAVGDIHLGRAAYGPPIQTLFATVAERAELIDVPASQIIGSAFKNLGLMVTINQRLDFDQIEMLLDYRAAGDSLPAELVRFPEGTLPEIRELGGLPADCPMSAVDLVAQQEVPLPEDAVHSVPPREPGRPLVKRTHFRRLS